MLKFLEYRKKYIMQKVRGRKCSYKIEGVSIDKNHDRNHVRTHMYVPTRNKNFFSSQRCTHFVLPSEFWISIYNDRNCPILDNSETETIRISLYFSHLLLKGEALSSRLLIFFRYDIHVQQKKLTMNVSKTKIMDVLVTQEKY